MEKELKAVIGVLIVLVILCIVTGVYFTFVYDPKPYGIDWEPMEEVEEIAKEPKDLKKEEVKKEPTVEQIIRELERSKPEFKLDILPNLIVENKDYVDLEEAKVETTKVEMSSDGQIYSMTTELTEEDILRLQAYKVIEKGRFVSFEEFDKERAKGWIKKVNPASFPHYKNAKVEWFTDSNLVYKTEISQTAIRGVLRIQYFKETKKYPVEVNKIYELDTEIVVSNTDNYNNTVSMKLHEITYLSKLKEVE